MRKLSLQGYKIGPVEAVMYSDVLVGSGLSSSAAFEVSIANMMSHFYNDGKISPLDMAIASQYAENVYFGKPCGLMDQSACAFGGLVFIDFNNIKDPLVRKLDVDFGSFGYSLCIVDTKGSHSGLTDDYAAIPEEMLSVASFFGKDVLRDVTYDQIIANARELRKVCGDRAVLRALHFAEENQRPALEAAALESGDFERFKELLTESGNSSYKYLQNVYTNHNVREQAVSLGLNLSEHLLNGGKGVCRVHGGGFAGTIQAFVRNDCVEEYKKGIEQLFGQNTCLILKVNKYGACKLIG
jgi:galactokinase